MKTLKRLLARSEAYVRPAPISAAGGAFLMSGLIFAAFRHIHRFIGRACIPGATPDFSLSRADAFAFLAAATFLGGAARSGQFSAFHMRH